MESECGYHFMRTRKLTMTGENMDKRNEISSLIKLLPDSEVSTVLDLINHLLKDSSDFMVYKFFNAASREKLTYLRDRLVELKDYEFAELIKELNKMISESR